VEQPLPAGWKQAKAADGRVYYFHTATKATQWTRPGPAAEGVAALPPLPPGWKEAKAADGRTYYYKPGTSSTTWVRPTSDVANGESHDEEPSAKRSRLG